jgi:hypothetical protein
MRSGDNARFHRVQQQFDVYLDVRLLWPLLVFCGIFGIRAK